MKCLLIASLVVVLLAQGTEAWWGSRTTGDVIRTTRDVTSGRFTRSVRHVTRWVRGWGKRDADLDELIADGVLTLEEVTEFLNMDEQDFKAFDDNGDGVIDESEFNDLQKAVELLSKQS